MYSVAPDFTVHAFIYFLSLQCVWLSYLLKKINVVVVVVVVVVGFVVVVEC